MIKCFMKEVTPIVYLLRLFTISSPCRRHIIKVVFQQKLKLLVCFCVFCVQFVLLEYGNKLFVLCVGMQRKILIFIKKENINHVLRGCFLAKEIWTLLSRSMVDQFIFFSQCLGMWMSSNINIGKRKGVNWSLYLLL